MKGKRLTPAREKEILATARRWPDYIKKEFAEFFYDRVYWKDRVAELELECRALRQPKFEGFAPKVYVPVTPRPEKFFSLDEKIAEHIEGGTTEGEAFGRILRWHSLTEEQAWEKYERYREKNPREQDQDARHAPSPVPGEPAGSSEGSGS